MNTREFFRLLMQVHGAMARRRFASLRQESWLMVGVIALFVAGYWVTAYFLFRWGFRFLGHTYGLGPVLIDRMLYLFFAFLFVMLAFSNMIIGYSAFFKSQETQWMLTLPVPQADVFRWKLVETALLASWAFVFLSAPLMLAYGVSRHVAPWFYAKVLLLLLPFAIIPAALGSLLILLVTCYLDRRVFKWAVFGFGTVLIAAVSVVLKPVEADRLQSGQTLVLLGELLHNSRASLQPLLPSYWVASGVIAWGNGLAWQGSFFFLVLASNALMAMLVCVNTSTRLFYTGWSRNHSQDGFTAVPSARDAGFGDARVSLLDRLFDCLPRIHPATRALMVKDIRAFWRDTSQWSQFVIFFGLLGLYVLNLRNVAYVWSSEFWATFVSFLNLGASTMTLATLTTRFVFPQFSLEGKRLWVVGMVPYGLKRVVLEKFWLSSFGSVVITLSLTLISSWMLHVPAWLTLLFSATGVMISFGLCGIAVGVGALFPNFGSGSTANRRDDNPAKIVSGFGGTFCFVTSLAYLILAIGAEALPFYLQSTGMAFTPEQYSWAIVGSWIFVSGISLAAICVPMTLALRRVETLEM